MSAPRRIVQLQDRGVLRSVILTLDAESGAIVGLALPAGDWNAWGADQRAFAARLSDISAGLRQGRGIAAMRQRAEALLTLLEQLEDAEALATLPARGRA